MEALELASWPQMEKGRQSVMSTFEPRFGGAHFLGGITFFRRGGGTLAPEAKSWMRAAWAARLLSAVAR